MIENKIKILYLHADFQSNMKKRLLFLLAVGICILFIQGMITPTDERSNGDIAGLLEITPWYLPLTDSTNLSKPALFNAYEGYLKMQEDSLLIKDSLLTIIDFSRPSTEKRMFIIDLKNQSLIYSSLVAHGQNSGVVYAEKFSNRPKSHMSSLGTYITSNTYEGKHGYSLRLDGRDKGLNDKARERAIVIHGANYVSDRYLQINGRIGRSFGCPALPQESAEFVINLIKEGSYLYIYHPSLSK